MYRHCKGGAQVGGAAGHFITGRDGGGLVLARKHGIVNRRASFSDHTIYRDGIAGTDVHGVARRKGVYAHRRGVSIGVHLMCHGGQQRQQPVACIAGQASAAQLQPSCGKHGCNEHGNGVEPHLAASGYGAPHTVYKPYPDAQRNGQIHVQVARGTLLPGPLDRGPGAAYKLASAVQHRRDGQPKAYPVRCCVER